jgi:hypothetical protein
MKKILITLTMIILGINLNGQVNKYGIPLIKNFSTQVTQGSDYTHSIIKDNLGNIYLANEDMGIIRYNGNSWKTIKVRNNALIRALGKDKLGTVYAGGKYEFGYLEPDNFGRMTYISLSQRFDQPENTDSKVSTGTAKADSSGQKIAIGEIFSLVVNESKVYFLSSGGLFEYNIPADSLVYVNLKDKNIINPFKIFLIGGKIIIGDNSSGLYEYKDRKIEMLPGGGFFNQMSCMIIFPYDDNRAVVATYDHGVFLYNYLTGEIKKDFLVPGLQKLLIDSRIYSGTPLPTGEFAIGTIQGGVFIVDHNGLLTKNWDKENSDLMDNGILSFYCDSSNNSELWISTVRFIAKVYINLPFTEFSPKSGIEGGVNSICKFNDDIYVSTDLGVFRSYTNKSGRLEFRKIPEIIDQVFPLFPAKVGSDEFLLAGSINGIFQIDRNGKTIKLSGPVLKNRIRNVKFDENIRVIVQSKLNHGRFFVGSNFNGISVIDYADQKWNRVALYKCGQGSVTGISELPGGDLIFSTDYSNHLYRVPFNDTIPILYGPDKGVPDSPINAISEIGNDVVLSTGKGLYKYVMNTDSWIKFDEITGGYSTDKETITIANDKDNELWGAFKDGDRYTDRIFIKNNGTVVPFLGPLAVLPNVKLLDIKDIDNKIWMAKSNSIFVVDKAVLKKKAIPISPVLDKIVTGRDSILMEESFAEKGEWGKKVPVKNLAGSKVRELNFRFNSISFFWTTPYFINEESTRYTYKLDGFDSDWSAWDNVIYKDYTNLPYGHYFFRVKAKTATDIVTEDAAYEFIILKPWYLTAVMIVLYGLVVLLIIFLIIKAYTRKLKNENIRLEGIVAERTAVVVKQKEELESSIHYASRIQMALLPSEAILSENIKNYFVLFKPRDIVSGDFYWMTKKGERLYIVAADCTGHGVPGAFMSLLGMSFLDEIIDKDLAPRADEILRELRLHVTESLKQVGGDDEAKDGMDIALLIIDFNVKRIEFSGAYNPCFRVRKLTREETDNWKEDQNEMSDGSMSDGKYILETIYASKMPIGISSRMNEEFVFHDWALEKGISYYLFSDGYLDQFGGPNGRKFMKKNFKRLILDIQEYPMNKQKDLLDQNLKEWMGHSPQIDDILVMGIRTE